MASKMISVFICWDQDRPGEVWIEHDGHEWVRRSEAGGAATTETTRIKYNRNNVAYCEQCGERLGVTWFNYCPTCGRKIENPRRRKGIVK